MPRAKTAPARIAETERQAEALEMRKAGKTFEQIAETLGYTDRGNAYRAVKTALDATIQEPADELRRLEVERLDALMEALWAKATDPDEKSQTFYVDRVLKVGEQRARLLGLNAPEKRIVDVVTHDVFARAIEDLEAEVGRLENPGDPSLPVGDPAVP